MNCSQEWEIWISKGSIKKKIGKRRLRKAIEKQMNLNGEVFCPYTGEILYPNIPDHEEKYPSVDHLISKDDHDNIAITTRAFNDIKNNFSVPELLNYLMLLKERYENGLILTSLLVERKKKGYGSRSLEKKAA